MPDHTYTIIEVAIFLSPALLSMVVLIGVLAIMATRRTDGQEMRRLTERVRNLEAEHAIDAGKLAAADRQIFHLGRMLSMLADLVVESGLALPIEIRDYLGEFCSLAGQSAEQTEETDHLLHVLDRFFDLAEIGELAFRLNVDFDNLAGERKADKARALICYLERRGRLDELIDAIREARPSLPWMGGRGPP
ncbi:MAG: hypothetical protein H6661_14530 [Ardenticatenaceae bacterium]|nr:hypothetical protein [Ardenticatenaceae bacterium]